MKKSKKNKRAPKPLPEHVRLPPGAVERKRYTEKLPCIADGATISVAAKMLAAIVREQEELDEERREINAGFREKQSSIKERQKKLAQTVEQGTESRPVDCVDFLLPNNAIRTVRLDTGETVGDDRTAEAEELQEQLDGVNGNGADHGDEGEGDDGILDDDQVPADAVKDRRHDEQPVAG